MAIPITMPKLGESVTEGQIVRWLKAAGEPVARFEAIVEVLTDKVTVEVPSPAAGRLVEIRAGEGETVPEGSVIALFEPEEPVVAGPTVVAGGQAETGSEAGAGGQAGAGGEPAGREPAAGGTRGEYSPAVRRLAREHQVDLAQVKGTGEGGRVTREDVLRFMAARDGATPAASAATTTAPVAPAPEAVPAAAGGPPSEADVVEEVPSPVRLVTARRLAESWATAPHAWTTVEADVTALGALREQLRDRFSRQEGIELTYLPFVVRAVAETLREFPRLNAVWKSDRIQLYRRIHIGVAVGTEEALWVPVVRDADRLSVAGLARTLAELIGRARQGKLAPDELVGATFTVNNTGALGSVLSAPIIPQGQGAILTSEAVRRRLVVLKDDQLAIRSVMNLCLSFDHRLIDGYHALRFLAGVRRRLEAFGPGSPEI